MLRKSCSVERPVVVADDAIPFLKGVLEPWFEVRYLRGADISSTDLTDADVLLVRTRTRCDRSLLEGTTVRLVATATIGTDHIDFEYCRSRNITVVSAPGCNSGGVCQYVFTALRTFGVSGGVLGVIGVGHVGSKVVARGRDLGFEVLCCDIVDVGEHLTPLDTLLERSDIVTLHIPLKSVPGTLPAYDNNGFADAGFFGRMKEGAVLINASRGEVLDDEAFLLARHRLGKVALDVWRNEPHINPAMLSASDIATPHIAGYSIQGKINGTQAVVRAVGREFDIQELSDYVISTEMPPVLPYDILSDDRALRANPSAFEQLRSNYTYRDDSL